MGRPGPGVWVFGGLARVLFSRRPRDAYRWSDFHSAYPQVHDPGAKVRLVITYNPDLTPELARAKVPTFAAWHVSCAGVFPAPLVGEPAVVGIEQLRDHWPVEYLGKKRVLVVGAGQYWWFGRREACRIRRRRHRSDGSGSALLAQCGSACAGARKCGVIQGQCLGRRSQR